MAGNVREWCFNGSGGQECVRGGSWSDPAYMVVRGQKLEPLDRSVLYGFRCVKRAERPVDRNRLLDSIAAPSVDEGIPAEPSEEVFAASSGLYRRDHTDLQPLVESTTQSRNWRR